MRILITGATGLVGNAIYKLLKKSKKNKIICISSKSNYNNPDFIKYDLLCPKENLSSIIKDIDCIIHCAASLPIHISDNQSGLETEKIDKCVYNFAKFSNAYLIYISSAFIYNTHDSKIKSETDDLYKHSQYHHAKIKGEKLFSQLKNYLIARISSPYSETIINRNVLGIFCNQAKNNEPITIIKNGNRSQDFINTYDIARFINLAIKKKPNGIFNVVFGKTTSIDKLAKFCKNLSDNSELEYIISSNKEPDYYPFFSNRKALEILGWQPKVSLKKGLKAIINAK